jgi:hypothetical protein
MRRLSLRTSSWITASLLLVTARASAAESCGAPGAAIRVEPAEVEVGMFYRGTKLHVEGTAPADCKVALVCLGHESKVELKRKGKVGGLLWMNVGDVAFEHVPSLFLQSSELDGIRPDAPVALGGRLVEGYERMEARVLPAGADEEQRRLFHEFVRLKEHEQLYLARSGPARASSSIVSADFWLPASVPPGKYEVQLLGGRGEPLGVLAASELTVKRVGLAALISSMAQSHGLIYGIVSVVLAIAMGFLTGVLFKASKKGH